MEQILNNFKINYEFIEAIYGKEIDVPHPMYDEKAYRLVHGKLTNKSEIGCYFSHIKALETFICSEHSHALIFEDDLILDKSFDEILLNAMNYSEHFDILRLSSLHNGNPVKLTKILNGFNLCHYLSYCGGAGSYLLNRKAAKVLIKKLIPMYLPYDHAFDREWLLNLRIMYIHPSPIKQNIFENSQIKATSEYKLKRLNRISTLLFRTYNELSRVLFRLKQLLIYKLIFIKINKSGFKIDTKNT
jgi:glycosyl transferase family 25